MKLCSKNNARKEGLGYTAKFILKIICMVILQFIFEADNFNDIEANSEHHGDNFF